MSTPLLADADDRRIGEFGLENRSAEIAMIAGKDAEASSAKSTAAYGAGAMAARTCSSSVSSSPHSAFRSSESERCPQLNPAERRLDVAVGDRRGHI
jgi:hypothetical protein